VQPVTRVTLTSCIRDTLRIENQKQARALRVKHTAVHTSDSRARTCQSVGFTASHGPDHLRIYEIEVEGQHGL
jgi:hypothetical protein